MKHNQSTNRKSEKGKIVMNSILDLWQSAWSPFFTSILCVTVIAILALLVTNSVVRQAAVRHTVLLCALLACVVGPVVAGWVSISGMPLATWTYSSNIAEKLPKPASPSWGPGSKPNVVKSSERLTPAVGSNLGPIAVDDAATRKTPARSMDRIKPSTADHEHQTVSWSLLLIGLWVSGAVVGVTRLVWGIFRINSIVKKASANQSKEIEISAVEVAAEMGLTKLPNLLESSDIGGPAVVGYRDARVLLPENLADKLDSNELQAVLTHEFAHVRRRDTWTLLAQSIIRSVYWPILPIHLLCESLTRAREEICDNYVLRQMSAKQYGRTLLKLGEQALGARAVGSSVGILNWSGKLENRIAGLLDDRRSATVTTPTGRSLLTASMFLVFAVAICGTQPADAVEDAPSSKASGNQSQPDSTPQTLPKDSLFFHTTVTDASGNGIANAKVELWQLAYSSGSKSPPAAYLQAVVTDNDGKASIPYPPFAGESKKRSTRRLGLKVTHQQFPAWSDYLPVDHDAAIELATPRWIEVTVTDPDNRPLKKDLVPIAYSVGDNWSLKDGKLRMGPLDLSSDRSLRLLRIAHVPDGKAPRFSKLINVSEADRDGNQVNLQATLEEVASVNGRLSDEVPRPVKNGFVIGTIVHLSDGNDRWYFSQKVPIAEDGTFEFPGLPRDENLQLLAICDGWLSLPPRPSEVTAYSKKWDYEVRDNHGSSTGRVTTQLHRISADEGAALVQMHPTGSAAITVVDWDDKPIEGVGIAFWPNQAHHNSGSQSLGGFRRHT